MRSGDARSYAAAGAVLRGGGHASQVLQTDKASRKWPATPKLEAALRAAFAECVPPADAQQREAKKPRAFSQKLSSSEGVRRRALF